MLRRILSVLITLAVLAAAALPAAPAAQAAALTSGIQLDNYLPSMKATSYGFSGTTTANTTVTAVSGGDQYAATSGADGRFSFSSCTTPQGTKFQGIPLVPNVLNTIMFIGGGGSYTYAYVTQDSLAPKAPVLYTKAQTTSETSLVVSGTAEADSTVTVKSGFGPISTVAVHGVFSVNVPLKTDATNRLQVTAADAAGNVSSAATVSVIQKTDNSNTDQTPPAAPSFTNKKTLITSQTSYAVTGTAEVGSSVEVISPLGSSRTTVGPDGSFSVTVKLTLDAYNEIDATATDQAGNVSGISKETVTQDSTAPGTPVLGTKDQATDDTSVTIAGIAESGSTVNITGGAAAAKATAAGTAPKPGAKATTGAFAVTVNLKKGVVNTLSATATDAAGNVSPAATVVVTQEGPPPAPTVTTKTRQTADSEIAVTGTAQPNTTVTVTGGISAVSVPTDGSGSFTVTVELNREMLNTLYVVETNAAGVPGDAAGLAVIQSESAALLPPPLYTITADAHYTAYGPKKTFSFKSSLGAGSIAVANARVLVVTTLASGKQTFDYFQPNGSASRQVFVDGTAVKSDLFLVGGEVTSVVAPPTYSKAVTVS